MDQGLLSVYNDAMNNCEAVPDYTAWAISNGFKSVPKGSACGEGFLPSSSTPAAMNGNAQYDVCFQARRGGMLPFPDGLVARMQKCLAPSGSPGPSPSPSGSPGPSPSPSGSPGPSPSPSPVNPWWNPAGLPIWALTLIFAIVLILFVGGFGYMISTSKPIN